MLLLRSLLWIVLFTTALFVKQGVQAAETKKALVAVPQISQLVKRQQDGSWQGPLIDVLRQVEEKSETSFDLKVVPFKRAVQMTKNDQADFGVFMESPKRNQMAMPVVKLGDAVYVIVSLKENQITSLDQLVGKTVAQIRGGSEVKSLSAIKGMKYQLFNTHEDGVRLLKGKRVDALLTLDFRVLEAIERLNLSYDEIARPLAVEARGLWLYWSWESKLDFETVRKVKRVPNLSIEGMSPAILFDSYQQN